MTACNDTIHAALTQKTQAELIDLICSLGIDSTLGLMTKDTAMLFHSEIESGKTLLYIDLANIHGANHLYGRETVDQFTNNVIKHFRHSDTWIRWGGDEIVCILNSGDIVDFIGRLDRIMSDNNLYAVYAYVTTSESLEESVNRADMICMQCKAQLEKFGLKAGRCDPYVRLSSQVVTEY
jgi:GGDEF domain-containing protein